MKPKILVITHIPSPYQVELFNGINKRDELYLNVWYVNRVDYSRLWAPQDIEHPHYYFDQHDNADLLKESDDFDLIVFGYYSDRHILNIMHHRQAKGKPWCFWGERPGYRRLGIIGTYYRKWKLSSLLISKAPIWGMGELAVNMYEKEFGSTREYFNLPYYSDLKRFTYDAPKTRNTPIVFLYSGSFIHRKGVDLLAQAFLKLIQNGYSARLILMGEGKLRKAIAKKLSPVKESVEFLGFKQWHELPNFYKIADVLCVPSRYDGWGLVVPEGLASGLPVISTNKTGSALDLIRHNNGWVVPAGDAKGLYDAMEEACKINHLELLEMSKCAKMIINTHSLDSGIEKFITYAKQSILLYRVA